MLRSWMLCLWVPAPTQTTPIGTDCRGRAPIATYEPWKGGQHRQGEAKVLVGNVLGRHLL